MVAPELEPGRTRAAKVEKLLQEAFSGAGWKVQHPPRSGDPGVDLLAKKGNHAYAIEIKAAPEGRSDRLIPLWAQACLQVKHAADPSHVPMAVVAAPRIRERTARQILEFATSYAPEVAAGVVDLAGLRRFSRPDLADLHSDAPISPMAERSIRTQPTDLFSDLNQWMLKVLLAPEIPEKLLFAPRERYGSASELARAAKVSPMTANRFVRILRKEGFLHESASSLRLVRRRELLQRWRAAARRPMKEAPMRFLLRGDPKRELARMLKPQQGCIALFAAADALDLGFVEGVPPYVYVPRLSPGSLRTWKNLAPVDAGESPDVILRQPSAPESVFRGAVEAEHVPVSDIIQVWLDVSAHPSRGQEQADLIRTRVLQPLLDPQDHG
jgi:DNA-binding transcriptional regulator YhcF (GntR family)